MEQSKQPDGSDPQLPTREQQLFIGTVVSVTWQLLVVVLVPFIGGHFLDQKLDSTPLWTLVGLGLALALAAVTIYRGYRTLAEGTKHVRNSKDT